MRPFSNRLFSPSGEPEGVLIASRDEMLNDDLENASGVDETVTATLRERAELCSSIPFGPESKLSYKKSDAMLEVVEGGVAVKQGRLMTNPVTARFEVNSPSYAALPRQVTESGVIALTPAGMAFTKDQFFSSGSVAATVVTGNVSIADWWKGSTWKNLGDYIRDAKATQ